MAVTAVVTDIQYRMSLALIRDLAQAGVRVVVCWREGSGAPLGFRSKYPAERVTLPAEGWPEALWARLPWRPWRRIGRGLTRCAACASPPRSSWTC